METMKTSIKWTLMLFLTLFVCISYAQEKTLTGVVTESGTPLPGVSIIIKGTQIGIQTDLDGKYSLKVNLGDVLVFSFIGLKDITHTVGTESIYNVSMTAEEQLLEEVVVTALGIKRSAKALGYATQEVRADELNKTSNTSLSGALQGKLAGVQITPSSGAPGASSQINIRGARSFTGNNTPLYVVDGMPISSTPDFSTGNSVTGSDIANRAVDIDPSDIESVSILKGQAASALYGIRASNGVVLITTKSGKGLDNDGKPVVSYSTTTSFETLSKKPSVQKEYAQGSAGLFNPYASTSWGPKISELPNDPEYGGNVANDLNGGVLRPGKYYVPQREIMGLDPWVEPGVYDNIGDYFRTGHTISNNLNVSQNTEKTNYSFGLGNSTQKGIMPGTSMDRYNIKLNAETKLSDIWKTGFTGNYVQTIIDKSSSANDSPLPGVFGAPSSYDLKGIGYANPINKYEQVFFRPSGFNNPYWAAENNEFSEKTNRFYGNTFIEFTPKISIEGDKNLTIKYQLGLDSYTSNFRDVNEFGHAHNLTGSTSYINLYGVTKDIVNSLLTINYSMDITKDIKFDALLGNEYNHENLKAYNDEGFGFNFGGLPTISNTQSVKSIETRGQARTVGFFANAGLSFKEIIFLNGSVRKDIVSNMPRGNRSFVYPSVSLGFVLTGIEALNKSDVLTFAKLRASYAQVGQAGGYTNDYYYTPEYSGGFWQGQPIVYPMSHGNSFVPYPIIFDENLKPQNTDSYEVGIDLRFFKNRLGVDYTYSQQDATDQIFQVPLAGSTGKASIMTNGGKMFTKAHEFTLFAVPIQTDVFEWGLNVNFSKVDTYVDDLKEGVDNIMLGGFVEPQIRASIGDRFPVIFGNSYLRNDKGQIIVDKDGLPQVGEQKVLGEISPKFILGGGMNFTYGKWSLAAVVEWKNGGKLYSGTNGGLAFYGMDSSTADREKEFVFDGVKEDGTVNDIAIGGDNLITRQDLESALSDITESKVFDASFVKFRELSLGYTFPKLVKDKLDLRVSAFARNILLWTKFPNLDPESSQGNGNMSGGFEHWSVPQAKSIGMSLNVTF